jgi:DNA-binding transcriptional LysR family regulator
VELRHLKTFQAVAASLSFHRAATALNYAQSTVSAQIQALEDDLGVRLFDRLGRRVLLTEAGERLLNYAQKMCDLADETIAEMSGLDKSRGSLTIRVPESLGVYRLPEVIALFRGRFPLVGLNFITCAVEGLGEDLRQGVTDLAFLLTDTFSAKDLAVEYLYSEPLVVVSPPGHRLARARAVDTREFEGETLLLSRSDCAYRRLLERTLAEAGVSPGMVLQFGSVAAIKSCVARGVGLTILPEQAAEADVGQGRMAAIDWSEGPLEAAALMVWHLGKWLSPPVRGFMDAATQILQK